MECVMVKLCLKIKVYFFWKQECDQTNSKSIDLPVSIKNLSCTFCEPGTKIDYNLKDKTITCVNCPINTYSTGGVLRMNGMLKEWEKLPNYFINHCYFEMYNSELEDKSCDPWQVSEDKTHIFAGNLQTTGGIYFSELSINVNILRKGKVFKKMKI